LTNTAATQAAEISANKAATDASITVLEAINTAQDVSITSIKSCGDSGMMFGAGHADADANDCISSFAVQSGGGIKIGTATTCDAPAEGTLRYNSVDKVVELCNGTAWAGLAAAGSGGGCNYNFAEVSGADVSTVYTSNQPTLNGFTTSLDAVLTGDPTATIMKNGANTGSQSVSVQNFDKIGIRVTAASNFSLSTNLSLKVGSSYTTCWTVTTKDQDATPDAFTFTDLTGQELGTLVTSNSVTLAGFDGPLGVTVAGQGGIQLSINSGAWSTSGNVNPGDTLQLRLTTDTGSEVTHTGSITVGTSAVAWNVQSGFIGAIGNRFSGISFNGGVSGGNMTNFNNLVDGNLSTQVGDSYGSNSAMTFVIYNISPKKPFNTLRGYVNSSTMTGALGSGGRWYDVYVEGSNDTTNGSNGTWTSIGWANGNPTRSLLFMPINSWVEYTFNTDAPYSAYRFRMSRVSQYIGLNEIELIAK